MKKKIIIISISVALIVVACLFLIFSSQKNDIKSFSYTKLRITPYLDLIDEYAETNDLVKKKYLLTRVELMRIEDSKDILLKYYKCELDKDIQLEGFVVVQLCSTQNNHGDIILLADYKNNKIIKELHFNPEANCLKDGKKSRQNTVKITTSFRNVIKVLISKVSKHAKVADFEKLVNSVKGVVLYRGGKYGNHDNLESKENLYKKSMLVVNISDQPSWKKTK